MSLIMAGPSARRRVQNKVAAPSTLVSASRWRLFMAQGNGGSNISIVELAFLDNVGGVISTAGGTASSLTQFNTSFAAAKAFDGLLTSTNRYASLGITNQWLEMAFASPVSPRTANIFPFVNAGVQTDAPRDFWFEYFNGSIWVQLGPTNSGYTTGWVQYVPRNFLIQ